MSYSSTVLADSPVSYWRLGETVGTSLADSGSANTPLTISGTYTLNQASLVDNTNACIRWSDNTNSVAGGAKTANTTAHNAGTTFSLECWVKTTATSLNKLMVRGTTSTSTWELWQYTDHTYFTLPGTSGYVTRNSGTTVTLNDNKWHHLVCTFDGSIPVMHMYIDGVLSDGTQTNGSYVAPVPGGSLPIHVASDYWSESYADAYIDEVAIYSVALTATQVSNHYNASYLVTNPSVGDTATAVDNLSRNFDFNDLASGTEGQVVRTGHQSFGAPGYIPEDDET